MNDDDLFKFTGHLMKDMILQAFLEILRMFYVHFCSECI